MDMVGPLERSITENNWIFDDCDYATRYPKAIPLKKVRAIQVANSLIQLFTRLGIPKEVIAY